MVRGMQITNNRAGAQGDGQFNLTKPNKSNPNFKVKKSVDSQSSNFQVLQGPKKVPLTLSGICDYPYISTDYPYISTDYRSIYYKKAKVRPSFPKIQKYFIIPTNIFEFGPLLIGRDLKACMEGQHPENEAKFAIQNDGYFDVKVDFSVENTELDLRLQYGWG